MLMMVCFVVTKIAITIIRKEQNLKIKLGAGLVDSDLRYHGRTLFELILFSFIGGWVSGALGLGGGSIFNPLLMSLGIPPSVSSSTGMYMIMFSTAGSSIAYILYGILNIQYALWIGIWCSFGSLIGLSILKKITKKYNRQSPIVIALTIVLGLSVIMVAIVGAIDLKNQQEVGQNIFEFHELC